MSNNLQCWIQNEIKTYHDQVIKQVTAYSLDHFMVSNRVSEIENRESKKNMMYVNVFEDSDLLIIIVIDLHIRYCSLINFRLLIKHNIYRVSK